MPLKENAYMLPNRILSTVGIDPELSVAGVAPLTDQAKSLALYAKAVLFVEANVKNVEVSCSVPFATDAAVFETPDALQRVPIEELSVPLFIIAGTNVL